MCTGQEVEGRTMPGLNFDEVRTRGRELLSIHHGFFSQNSSDFPAQSRIREAMGQCLSDSARQELALDWFQQAWAIGNPGPVMAFHLQSFRNSESALILGRCYGQLNSENSRCAFENELKKASGISDSVIFELLFGSSFRPYVLNPYDRPELDREIPAFADFDPTSPNYAAEMMRASQSFLNFPMVRMVDEENRVVFRGVEGVGPAAIEGTELSVGGANGNMYYVYNDSGRIEYLTESWHNEQPHIWRFNPNDPENRNRLGYKSYLRNKGSFHFYLSGHDESTGVPQEFALTPEEADHCRNQFFNPLNPRRPIQQLDISVTPSGGSADTPTLNED